MSEKNEIDINVDFIKEIQQMGGISFKDESVIKTGDGYETCLHVMRYPTDLDKFWLANLTSFNGTVATIDISNEDVNKVKKNLNRSMKEQNHRYVSATDYTTQAEAEQKFCDMKDLMEEISAMDEVVKNIDTRIFLCDRSWLGLDEKVKNTKTTLENKGYQTYVNLNETKADWCSMHQTYTQQQENQYAVVGQALTAHAVAGGNPFHFSSLEDKNGLFFGTTPTGGNVLLDLFAKTHTRRHYNALMVGTMGAGKSTGLKKILEDRIIRGDYVRAFDVSGEFTKITNEFGGKVLKLDGTDDNALNPLEILRAGDEDSINFARHIAKLNTFYRFIVPKVEQEEVTMFSNCMNEFYDNLSLTPEEGRKIIGLPSKDYPIFSDFHEFLQLKKQCISEAQYNEVQIAVAQHELLLIEKIDKEILKLINTYGTLFDRHTSMDNILDEQAVTFDISKLKDMDANIFDAQIFSMVSLCWDNAVTNGTMMNRMFREGKISFEDVVRFEILIDESHRWINAEKLQALDMIITYMREARKYFAGIVLASQSIRDYVPEGSDSIAINKLKTLFELTQYKFIFHQDSNTIPLIRNIFNDVLTESQIERIPKLETGSCILSIASTCNLEFNIFITDEEEYLFDGGI